MPIKTVKLQQSGYDAPLDDIIVEFEHPLAPKLHLQVKRALKISSAESNTAFREIIINSWATYKHTDNASEQNYYGGATDTISSAGLRRFRLVSEAARNSHTSDSFFEKTTGDTTSTPGTKKVVEDIKTILSDAGVNFDDSELHHFFKHLVIYNFDVMAPESLTPDVAINSLRHILLAPLRASDLWEKLKNFTRAGSGVSGTYNRESLIFQLSPLFAFKDVPRVAVANIPISSSTVSPSPNSSTPIKCHIALSQIENHVAPGILTAIVLTDTPEGIANEVKQWREALKRSSILSDDDKETAGKLALKELFQPGPFTQILAPKLATLSFLTYIYYAKDASITTWPTSEKVFFTLTTPLLHRLSKKHDDIVAIYSNTEEIKAAIETAITDVHTKYRRITNPTLAARHTRNGKELIELADLVAAISMDYISGGDQYPKGSMALIRTRIKYAENIITGEKHKRDKNPLA